MVDPSQSRTIGRFLADCRKSTALVPGSTQRGLARLGLVRIGPASPVAGRSGTGRNVAGAGPAVDRHVGRTPGCPGPAIPEALAGAGLCLVGIVSGLTRPFFHWFAKCPPRHHPGQLPPSSFGGRHCLPATSDAYLLPGRKSAGNGSGEFGVDWNAVTGQARYGLDCTGADASITTRCATDPQRGPD
jgi:hypothetical protein